MIFNKEKLTFDRGRPVFNEQQLERIKTMSEDEIEKHLNQISLEKKIIEQEANELLSEKSRRELTNSIELNLEACKGFIGKYYSNYLIDKKTKFLNHISVINAAVSKNNIYLLFKRINIKVNEELVQPFKYYFSFGWDEMSRPIYLDFGEEDYVKKLSEEISDFFGLHKHEESTQKDFEAKFKNYINSLQYDLLQNCELPSPKPFFRPITHSYTEPIGSVYPLVDKD